MIILNKMKRLISAILILTAMSGFGQTQVSISGTVTEGPSGFPVPMQPVYFMIAFENDSLWSIADSVITNDSGYYSFIFILSGGSQARVDISTPDCNGTMLGYTWLASPNMTEIIQNFNLCGGSGGCLAQFTYYPDSLPNGLAYQFMDLSTGWITQWDWDFGDGTTSQEQNPLHIFPVSGTYEVCLIISGPECQSTWCLPVTTGTYGDCYNFFTYQTAGTTVTFQGNHFPAVPADFSWDFGDGTTVGGQQASHTYAEAGVYYVSLVTTDSSGCTASSGQEVVVGDTILYNQVYGQVFEGYLPMREGRVMIASVHNNPGFEPFTETAPVDSSGVFVFPYIPAGQFVLYAIPEQTDGYLPTYFGGTRHWAEATTFNSLGSGMIFTISLNPLNAAPLTGFGMITGIVNATGIRDDLVGQIQVILYSEDFVPLGYTGVSPDGSFSFEGLASGLYYIHPELPGIASYPIAVEITVLTFESVVFLNFDGTSILGEKEIGLTEDEVLLYPNPASEYTNLSITCKKPVELTARMIDLAGRTCFTGIYQVNTGTAAIEIPLEGLEPGIYLLKIAEPSGKSAVTKLIKR